MMKIPKVFYLLIFLLAALGVFTLINKGAENQKSAKTTTFDECVLNGNPIQESYPPRCTTKTGQTFTQGIGNELEKNDLITIQNPRPNQIVKSPLEIRGAARGTWFFEASFPIKLLDKQGNIIAEIHAEATEDWMTDEFVPYKANLEFKTIATHGVLILEKNNPSGLPENEDKLEVPIKFN